MDECQEVVPNLIGKIRETRQTKNHIIVPKGYRTKELIGKEQADEWKDQVKRNLTVNKVLDDNKLQEDVEDILHQQKM